MRAASRLVSARPAAGAAIAWLTAVAVFAQAPPAGVKNPIAASAESVAAGKQSYTRLCAPCHGTSAEGGAGNDLIPASPDLTDREWEHGGSDGEVFASIRNGIGPEFNMTPFKDRLTDTEIWNVVNYLRSIVKK